MSKLEYPKWVYPDAPETTRGKVVHNDAEAQAYWAECQVPVINGDTSRAPADVLEHKEYADGTTATGAPPLPDTPPAEQAVEPVKAKNKPGRKPKAK